MADGTDELAELEAELDASEDFQDEEASAALSEAQSVIDDAESVAGGVDLEDSASTSESADAGSAASESESNSDSDSGSLLPSLSLPSPSLPSPGELFSVRFFGVAVVGAVGAAVLGGLVPLVDFVFGGPLVFLGLAFLFGLASSRRHYLETALAGAATFGGFLLLSRVSDVIREGAGAGLRLLAFTVGGAVLAGLVGTYLGRDVRRGILGDPEAEPDGGGDDQNPSDYQF